MTGEATWWALIGASATGLAAVAVIAERRRLRRRDLDAVGFVPWTAFFLVALLAACVALGLAARTWLAG